MNRVVAAQNAGGEVSYFTTDLLGSVRSTTDSTGFGIHSYTYDVFGSLVEGELSGATDYGYLGKQFDLATGLYNYGYRDYSPQVARFTTVDPIRDGENWFAYVNNDPVNFVDLWGLSASDADMAGVPPQYRKILQEQKEKYKAEYINPTTGEITSEFGPRESFVTDNGEITNPFHGGIDEANVEGTPIVSSTDGIVIDVPKTSTESPYGNYVIIGNKSQGWSNYTLYGYLKDPTPLKVGDVVKQGNEIGKMGQTGNSKGPHLHFEIRIDGEKKNPRDYVDFGD